MQPSLSGGPLLPPLQGPPFMPPQAPPGQLLKNQVAPLAYPTSGNMVVTNPGVEFFFFAFSTIKSLPTFFL